MRRVLRYYICCIPNRDTTIIAREVMILDTNSVYVKGTNYDKEIEFECSISEFEYDYNVNLAKQAIKDRINGINIFS